MVWYGPNWTVIDQTKPNGLSRRNRLNLTKWIKIDWMDWIRPIWIEFDKNCTMHGSTKSIIWYMVFNEALLLLYSLYFVVVPTFSNQLISPGKKKGQEVCLNNKTYLFFPSFFLSQSFTLLTYPWSWVSLLPT